MPTKKAIKLHFSEAMEITDNEKPSEEKNVDIFAHHERKPILRRTSDLKTDKSVTINQSPDRRKSAILGNSINLTPERKTSGMLANAFKKSVTMKLGQRGNPSFRLGKQSSDLSLPARQPSFLRQGTGKASILAKFAQQAVISD